MKCKLSILCGMVLAVAATGLVLVARPGPGASRAVNVRPPSISTDKSIQYDYPIVYVRVPRPYPKEYCHLNHLNQAGLHQTNAPGAELRLLHPDGRDESLVAVGPQESITDPAVSFDGQWVYYARFHEMGTKEEAHMTRIRSRRGSDIYKVHVRTRKVVQLTHQERTPNTGVVPEGTESHPRGVHNLAPCPVPGGKIVFVSDRNGYRGVREQTQAAVQLFVMDDDGSNVDFIAPMNLGGALHPVPLKDGRVMFSSLETQGLRGNEQWGIWAIHPDGTHWGPLTSALGSPRGQAVHFQAQLSDESIVVESYYQTGSTDGFGTFWKFPMRLPEGQPRFLPGAKRFAPIDLVKLTRFASESDVRPNHKIGNVNNETFAGNVTHPSAAPDNHLLLTWSLPSDAQDPSTPLYDAGIYLLKSGQPIDDPGKMLLVKNDPKYQELWPRALVPYKRIYGVDEPKRLVHVNDGKQSKHLPAGTPFGLVGSSSLYKRESYPGGVVPPGSVTARSPRPNDRKQMWRELAPTLGNWDKQGADAGLYENSDIWGIRIVLLEPVSDLGHRLDPRSRHFALVSNTEERLRILGEFPVRKFGPDGKQPLDPDGNHDTSFLAKIPADTAFTFQTLDNNGMVLNMAQTWHQVRPGEIRNDCGGCHAHSQKPTLFEKTAAAKPDYPIWDLTKEHPLFTTRANDRSGRKADVKGQTGVRLVKGVQDVEFYRDVKPILDRSCVACHTIKNEKPAGGLALDDYRPDDRSGFAAGHVTWSGYRQLRQNLPRTYARMAQYSPPFQSRRSLLIWKVYGRRLDGFRNEDIQSPRLDYDNDQHIVNWGHHHHRERMDVDYKGSVMPPPEAVAGSYKGPDGKLIKVQPLSDEDRLTLVRWIDLGSPIDCPDPKAPAARSSWLLDEGRPTLTLTVPEPGASTESLTHVLLGMHDYGSGLNQDSFTVKADFPIDGIAAGQNLASRFKELPDHRWELKLARPITRLPRGKVEVSVKDRQGNITRIQRTFSISSRAGG
jgi:Hydrazine synthase alpha subunit middle domain